MGKTRSSEDLVVNVTTWIFHGKNIAKKENYQSKMLHIDTWNKKHCHFLSSFSNGSRKFAKHQKKKKEQHPQICNILQHSSKKLNADIPHYRISLE